MAYEESLKIKRDYESVVITAKREGETIGIQKGIQKGLEKGLEKGRAEERAKAEAEKRDIARAMKQDGMPVEQIAKFTKLSIEEIERLK